MKKYLCVLLSALLLLTAAAGCSDVAKNSVHAVSDLPGKKAGVLLGSQAGAWTDEIERDGAAVSGYADGASLMQALVSGSLDCVITDASEANTLQKAYKKTKILDEALMTRPLCAVTAKENADLRKELNKAFAALTEDGTIVAIEAAYADGSGWESAEPSGEKSITLAVADCAPYAWKDGGSDTGIDVDVARSVCAWLGIGLKIVTVKQDELVETVRMGGADFAMGRLYDNDADRQLVDFTDAYMTCHQVILVRKK